MSLPSFQLAFFSGQPSPAASSTSSTRSPASSSKDDSDDEFYFFGTQNQFHFPNFDSDESGKFFITEFRAVKIMFLISLNIIRPKIALNEKGK